MKWTRDKYVALFEEFYNEKKDDPSWSSKPKFLFKTHEDYHSDIFNKDNWNGTDLVRKYCSKVWDGDIKDDRVTMSFDNDQWTAVIIIERPRGGRDIYYLTWYKSRGHTELIHKNGNLIDIDDYVELMNILGIEDPRVKKVEKVETTKEPEVKNYSGYIYFSDGHKEDILEIDHYKPHRICVRTTSGVYLFEQDCEEIDVFHKEQPLRLHTLGYNFYKLIDECLYGIKNYIYDKNLWIGVNSKISYFLIEEVK